jgi:DsbC/DsbD-like thiol-disulfide interchange protein
MTTKIIGINLLLLFFLPDMQVVKAQPSPGSDHVDFRFIHEYDAFGAGTIQVAGLHIKIEEGWHVYWKNPGDSGMPVRLKWQDSGHLQFGDIEWPYPATFREGHLVTYGYKEEAVLFVPFFIDEDAAPGTYSSEVRLEFLVCKEICLPGFETLTHEIEVSYYPENTRNENAALFDRYLNKIPGEAFGTESEFFLDGDNVILQIKGNIGLWGDLSGLTFFSDQENVIESSAEQKIAFQGNILQIKLKLSRYLDTQPNEISGVLVIPDKDSLNAVRVMAIPGRF